MMGNGLNGMEMDRRKVKELGSMKIYKPTINEWIMIVVFVVIAFNGLTHL
jgi:hypothetical protein